MTVPDWPTLDWAPTRARPPLRLLLVGANERWTRATRTAVAELGHVVLDSASNSLSALRSVLTASPPYSLVLLQARRGDKNLDDLADLTAGDAGSCTGLMLLGGSGPRPSGSIVIEQACCNEIGRALSRHPARAPAATAPSLSEEEALAAVSGPMLTLRYQPIVRLSDQQPIGLEVLARLDHPELGMLSAEQFIPQMEAGGHSWLLAAIMITRAMRDAFVHGLGSLGLRIGLNVPLNVMLMPGLVELIETERRRNDFPASQIVIELTETEPVTDLDGLRQVLCRLRDMGYHVAIDDAFPEMANLDMLLEMPFTTLKFDKSVVQGASSDPACRGFIEQTVQTARTQGIRTVAEGIEDSDTENLMRDLGVENAQGFLIARPLPPAAVKLWLETCRAD